MKRIRGVLAFLLALAMVLGPIPMIFAEDIQPEITDEECVVPENILELEGGYGYEERNHVHNIIFDGEQVLNYLTMVTIQKCMKPLVLQPMSIETDIDIGASITGSITTIGVIGHRV